MWVVVVCVCRGAREGGGMARRRGHLGAVVELPEPIIVITLILLQITGTNGTEARGRNCTKSGAASAFTQTSKCIRRTI